MKQPHIIIFNPDEMRADTLSHLGNPAAVTPNLDAFARTEAVSFRNAFCQNPVCVPSRCSFFTGLYPHVNGHRTMTHLLRPGEISLFGELRAAGYHVWMNDRNDLCAGQYDGWVESQADEIFYPGLGRQAPGAVHPELRGEPNSPYYYSHYEGELRSDARGLNYSQDDETVDAAIQRAAQWRPDDKPLCMFLGLFFPHPPYAVEEPYFSSINRAKLPPRVTPESCSGKSRMMSLIRQYQHLQGFDETDWDELRAVYLGMCMKIDRQFGHLCQGLKEAGIYDDCAIFVLSDHGDFAGDYSITEKAQNCFEDCLTRVPFLIKPPRGTELDPGISDGMVELVDFYATAMDFAQAVPSHEHYGKSLRPILANRAAQLRQYAFCEGGRNPGEVQCDEYHGEAGESRPTDVYWPKKKAQMDDEAHAKATMIRSKQYKYISRTLGGDELYDLRADPGERINRINDPALIAVRQELQAAMLKWLQTTSDVVPLDYDRRWTEEMLWNKVQGLVPPQHEADVRQRIRSGIGLGALFGYCMSLRQ